MVYMIDAAKKERMDKSAKYFWDDIRPLLEPRLKAKIHSLELLQRNELVDAFDQVGIDAFTFNRGGHPQGLASRMQYTDEAAQKPNFSFRFALLNKQTKKWMYNREYQRKLYAINNTDKAILYPHYHVESCFLNGVLKWCYITKTADVLQYIEKHINDKTRVHRYTARSNGEIRKVIGAYILEYMKDNPDSVARIR